MGTVEIPCCCRVLAGEKIPRLSVWEERDHLPETHHIHSVPDRVWTDLLVFDPLKIFGFLDLFLSSDFGIFLVGKEKRGRKRLGEFHGRKIMRWSETK